MAPLGHATTPILTACIVIVVLVGPQMAFGRALFVIKRAAVFQYGELASRVGIEFERKWRDAHDAIDATALGVPDFSATTDFYSVAANVYSMRMLPFDYRSVIPIAAAVLVPFVPIWLTAVPLKDVIHALIGVRL